MVQIIRTWVMAITFLIVLNIAFAIFSPIVNSTLNDLAIQEIQNNSVKDALHPHNNGMNTFYYQQLNSARLLVVNMFNIFGVIISFVIIVWAILQSLRREEDTYVA